MKKVNLHSLFYIPIGFVIIVGCSLSYAGMVTAGTALSTMGGMLALSGLWLMANEVTEARHRCSQLHWAVERSERHCLEVLWKVIQYVEARERWWQGHSKRVGELAMRIAGKMGMSPEKCAEMDLAGRLHDIGLFAVPDSVINKYTNFGVDEFRSVKKHSQVSYEVLKPLDCLSEELLLAIRYHHERINGTGYPAGLAGENVPIEARILAVADSYDAMTHDRPHRKAMSPMQAMQELWRCTPAGYDAESVDALARSLKLMVPRASVSNSATAEQPTNQTSAV